MRSSNQKGSTLILGVIIGAVLVLVLFGAYYLGTKKNETSQERLDKQNPNPTYTGTNQITTFEGNDETAGWSTFKSTMVKGLTVKHPATLKVVENGAYIAEKYAEPNPDGGRPLSKYFIDFREHFNEMYVGYTTKQWFEKINALAINGSFEEGGDKATKILSGTVKSGEPYVLYAWGPSVAFQGESTTQIRANILAKDDKLYDLILNEWDEEGLSIFKKIVATAEVE